MTQTHPTTSIKQAIEALELITMPALVHHSITNNNLKKYVKETEEKVLNPLKAHLPANKELVAIAEALKWKPISEAPIGYGHEPIECRNIDSNRTYTPCRRISWDWEWWNEISGVWEKCRRQPTHYREIIDLDNFPAAKALVEEG